MTNYLIAVSFVLNLAAVGLAVWYLKKHAAALQIEVRREVALVQSRIWNTEDRITESLKVVEDRTKQHVCSEVQSIKAHIHDNVVEPLANGVTYLRQKADEIRTHAKVMHDEALARAVNPRNPPSR